MSLKSIVDAGTKLWLDSVDPDEVARNRKAGATGATSNPIIISGLIKSGRFDEHMTSLFEQKMSDEAVAWAMTDYLVGQAQQVFQPVWQDTKCNDGWVSFELDPLLEDVDVNLPKEKQTHSYIELGKHWGIGRGNRMIKVPATPGGLAALEDLAAAGIPLNVTLIFTLDQYRKARDAIWKGAQRREQGLDTFKSVYSIFISRVDVYTDKQVKDLSDDAQGEVGLFNAKRLWQENQAFWKGKNCPLDQEIIFASTGAKLDWQAEDYYVSQLVGSDIQTNPPETNAAIDKNGKTYTRTIDKMPGQAIQDEIDKKVSVDDLHRVLMEEGLKKFADPQKALLKLIKEKRATLVEA